MRHTALSSVASLAVDCVWNVMAHAQKSDFVFRLNGRVHLNQLGSQFSRLLPAEVCASAVVMLDTPCSEVVWRVLATHSIRQFLLHFPSLRRRVPSHFSWILLYFFVISYKRHDFRGGGGGTEKKICVLIFLTNLFETLLILRRTERDIIKNVYRSASCKVPVIHVRF
jgi:hypothetical protein